MLRYFRVGSVISKAITDHTLSNTDNTCFPASVPYNVHAIQVVKMRIRKVEVEEVAPIATRIPDPIKLMHCLPP